MLKRFIDVIYWICCGIAIVTVVVGVDTVRQGNGWGDGLIFLAIAAIIWLVGKALRYIFLGESFFQLKFKL